MSLEGSVLAYPSASALRASTSASAGSSSPPTKPSSLTRAASASTALVAQPETHVLRMDSLLICILKSSSSTTYSWS